ncbi:hypothetical protein FRC17_004739 [Serendipita sp. 399]|nr:hypothetical protein FRC17_004739 [Serendipita sp. 399]
MSMQRRYASRKPGSKWFVGALISVSAPENSELSYAEKLAIFKKAAPPKKPTRFLILRNLNKPIVIKEVKKVLPNTKTIQPPGKLGRSILHVTFSTVEDAQNALKIVNEAASYPFGTTSVDPLPVFAEFGDIYNTFDLNGPKGGLLFHEYHGTREHLETILAPFVPAGHELKISIHGQRAWAEWGSRDAARDAFEELYGSTYSDNQNLVIQHVTPRFKHPRAWGKGA